MKTNQSTHLLICLLTLLFLSYGTIAAQDDKVFAGTHLYFSESSNEASPFDRSGDGLSRFAGLLQELGAELHTIDWRTDVPSDADLVVIAGPTRDLSAEQIARLWVYLTQGGKLLLVAEPLVTDEADGVTTVVNNRALQSARGFFELTWSDFGLRGRDDVLLLPEETEAVSPDLVTDFTTTSLDTSPIGTGEELAFFGARSIEFDGSIQRYVVTPLVFAAADFYGETGFADYVETGTIGYDIESDVMPGELIVAAAAEQPDTGARILLIGDRQFLTNGGGLQTSPPNTTNLLYPGNVQFALDGIRWLLGIESPVEIPITYSVPAPTATIVPTSTPSAEATESASGSIVIREL
jgi:hypothetical protein